MIKFRRGDNMSIYISFDKSGLSELISAMKAAKNGGRASVQAEFDKSVTTLKRRSPKQFATVEVVQANATTMSQEAGSVMWSLHSEDLEYAIYRLIECESTGEFNPAEFMKVQISRNKLLDDLYGEMVEFGEAGCA